MRPLHYCSQDLIKSLKLISLPDIEVHDCGICLETYQMTSHNSDNNEDVPTEHPVQLPCSHIVGSGCISRWLESHNTCPFCRAKLYDLKTQLTSPDSMFQEAAAADFFRSDNIHTGDVELSNAFLQILDEYDVDDMDGAISTVWHVGESYDGSLSHEPTPTLYIQTSTYHQPSSQPQQLLNFSHGSYHRGCGSTSPTVEISKCQASLELEEAVSCAAKHMDDLIDMHEEWMVEYNNNEKPGMCDGGFYDDDDEWMEEYKHEFRHVDGGLWLLC